MALLRTRYSEFTIPGTLAMTTSDGGWIVRWQNGHQMDNGQDLVTVRGAVHTWGVRKFGDPVALVVRREEPSLGLRFKRWFAGEDSTGMYTVGVQPGLDVIISGQSGNLVEHLLTFNSRTINRVLPTAFDQQVMTWGRV